MFYTYQCDNCGHKKEIRERPFGEKKKVCPSCSSKNFIRLISNHGFKIEGMGVYDPGWK